MKIKKITPIKWEIALDKLSAGAYFLLSVLWHKDIDVSDKAMMDVTGVGVSTHRKHKRELLDNGYIVNKQIGKGAYRYHIGERVHNG